MEVTASRLPEGKAKEQVQKTVTAHVRRAAGQPLLIFLGFLGLFRPRGGSIPPGTWRYMGVYKRPTKESDKFPICVIGVEAVAARSKLEA